MKHWVKNSLYLLCVLALVACQGQGLSLPGAQSDVQVVQAATERDQAPDASGVGQVAQGNNAFTWDLYRQLRVQPGNLFYSPYSISSALAMTYAGARGETERQMAQVLHFNLEQAALHPAFNALDLALVQDADQEDAVFRLRIANSLWGQQDFVFLPEFINTLGANYGAGLRLLDFRESEAARTMINAWVSEQTEERIKDLIPPNVLDADTRLVLTNAIYFKADWEQTFDPNNTYDRPFNALDGSAPSVPMMSDSFSLPYAEGETEGGSYQALEMPYAGGRAAMVVILPEAGAFETFESQLDAAQLDAILQSLAPHSLKVILPKFTFESEFELKDTLDAMGMPDAFDARLADFSGMNGKRDLFIGAVIHKAFVGVDEKGTEAAAATAVEVQTESAMMEPELVFNADRPFLFLIRDTQNGAILFAGRFVGP